MPEQKQLIHDPDSGIKISLLPGWKWRYEEYDGIKIHDRKFFILPPDENKAVIIAAMAKNGNDKVTKELEEKFSTLKIHPKTAKEKFGDFDYDTYKFTVNEKGQDLAFKIYTFNRDADNYSFLLNCKSNDLAEYAELWEEMLATLDIS